MDVNTLDVVLVVALSLVALSSLLFLVFFIPVLIQASKTLQAVNELLELVSDYTKGLSSGIKNTGMQALSLVLALKDGIKDLFHYKK